MTKLQTHKDEQSANEIRLIGRVRTPVETRILGGGLEVLSFSMTVARPNDDASLGQGSDIIDISCRSARARQAAAKLAPDVAIEVNGALHHRFWRAGGRTASRYEVDAQRIVRTRGG